MAKSGFAMENFPKATLMFRFFAVAGCLVALVAVDVHAQTSGNVPSEGLSRRIVRKAQPLPSIEPLEIGSFLVYPDLTISSLYDDNVYYSGTDKAGDWALIASPTVFAQSNWQRHAVNLYANVDATRYLSRESENSDDYRVSAEGRYDFTQDSNVYGGVRWAQEHEDRESPDSRNGFTPTRYSNERAYGGVFRQLGRLSLRIGGTVQRLDYSDVKFLNGIINMDDRDRTHYTGGVRAGWEVSPQFEPFLQIAFDTRRYSNDPDDALFRRDSDGERYLLGARLLRSGTAKAEVFVGYATQRYEDPRFPVVQAPTFGANVVVRPKPGTTLSIYVDRTIEETSLAGASANLNTYTSLALVSRLTSLVAVHCNGAFSRNEYQLLSRTDDYVSFGLGAYWYLGRSVILETTVQFRNLRSSVSTEDFEKTQALLRLVFPLEPRNGM